ncbi:response regulator transcription factor [bacterium]|jgi:two-component system, OmpR family, phosphate regulon response regulator PhoB|nr:response regulator transcription factor [Planctomicrobium sp.]MDA7504074.1 response regulator transcription factor [bacterium]
MSRPRILIVEDEMPILDALQYNFQKENFDVTTATSGREALRKCQAQAPDLVLLDLMIPPPDGLQVCRELRSDPRTKNIRIIMLTAKDEEVDEVVGFSMGADDYVAKPFKIRPLIERVKALLRRNASDEGNTEIIEVDGIKIDRQNHMVTIDGEELILTQTEFKLLWTLSKQPGRTFSRNELLDVSRGEDANSMERTIDVHVRALRKKLLDRAELVETIRGIGYRFKPNRG